MIDKIKLQADAKVVNRKDIDLDTIKNAKELTQILYEASVEQVNSLGALPFPTVFVLDEKNCLLLDASRFMRSEDEKDTLAALLRTMALNPTVIAIALAYEAYMVEATKEESKTITSLEKHPNRLDSIVVHGEWRYADDYLIFGRILRDKDRNVIEVLQMMEGPQQLYGRFSNLFIPLPMPGEFNN